jgi:hypothetical protein
MRRWSGNAALVAAASVALAAACVPEIGGGTYFCGPERLCPPGLVCDDSSYTCELDAVARPFSCPAGSEDSEPDDSLAAATAIGTLECGRTLLDDLIGCMAEGDTVDYFRFEHTNVCSGQDPHIEILLRFPVAMAPLRVELLDEQGQVIQTGEHCTQPGDFTGTDRHCLRLDPPPLGVYYVRVSLDPDGPDCGGQCRYNRYTLDIKFPLA